MTKLEAKRYACRMIAREIAAHSDAYWVTNNWETKEEFSEQDLERVGAAFDKLTEELARRGQLESV